MKIYLVGGAVRDKLHGKDIKERDWVVVGATVQDMLKLGYRQVGKDFPVFLHPQTNEEYALARTERKIGRGYTGFEFNTSPAVTLEEDLLRRDLTINAMAEDTDGNIIDPYHGQDDLKNKLLRHVSPAFAEDPVRILRVARFAARFNFVVAPETIELMRSMVTSGEINALVAERVWKELERALKEPHPEQFFDVLQTTDALKVLFPDNIRWQKLPHSKPDVSIRFAILFHQLSESEAHAWCDRYKIPNECRELALLTIKYLPSYQKAEQLTAEEILNLFMAVDAFRREARFKQFLEVCSVLDAPEKTRFFLNCFAAIPRFNPNAYPEPLSGQDIANKIKEMRLDAIKKYKNSQA